MHFQLFGIHVTFAAHVFRRKFQFWHDCNVTDCPARRPPDGTKYVIADRHVGRYSARFDTEEDAEAALEFFEPILHSRIRGTRYEILETFLYFGGWIIADPPFPEARVLRF